MGKNITLHLLEQGVEVVAYNRSQDDIDEVVAKGAIGAFTLAEILSKFTEQMVVLLFVPSGSPVDEVLFGASSWRDPDLVGRPIVSPNRSGDTIGYRPTKQGSSFPHDNNKGLAEILPKGSIIIDGGNSFYKDSQRRYRQLKEKGLLFLDMGTSGGLDGARNGACLMVGGDEAVYQQVRPVLEKIAIKNGLGYFGPSGAGHFVKMVHNAIEYGMMGAIAEGFNLVRSSPFGSVQGRQFAVRSSEEVDKEFTIDLAKLARVWAHGSIISGLLMDKMVQAFAKDPKLSEVAGEVPRGETEVEMEWLEATEIDHPVIQQARKERVETRTKPSFIGKVIAALRREFGGHAVKKPA